MAATSSAALAGQPHARGADQFLDAGIDVGAIIGPDAGIEGGDQVGHRLLAIDRAVPAGKLPAAANDARNRIAGAEFEGLGGHFSSFSFGSGTAVVSAWLNAPLAES